MDFNVTVKNVFLEFLNGIDFSIIEDHKTEVSFKSEKITIRFIFFPYGYEYYYFIKLNSKETEYQNFIVEQYLKLGKQTIPVKADHPDKAQLWAKQIHSYLVKYQDSLLKGDEDLYLQLDEYYKDENRKYNKKLSKRN
jgi:hypothetical protein